MKDCKHKNKHTEKIQGSFGIVISNFIMNNYYSNEIPPRNSYIETFCADCGKKLKSVELNDYIPNLNK